MTVTDRERLRLEVEPEPVPAEFLPELRAALLSHSVVRLLYPTADLWLVGLDLLEKDGGEGEGSNVPFRVHLTDLAGSAVAEAEGVPWDLEAVAVFPTSRPRLPNDEEHAWAADVLRSDPSLRERIEAGEVTLYRPSPPLANVQDADGSVIRAVTVGVREAGPDGAVRHRVVAVRSVDGEILEEGPGIPPPGDGECGLPDAPSAPGAAGEERARVRVWRGEELLWDLVVVRPSASSGANGSGVELRTVDYQRVRVLHRAHLPIVAVERGDGGASREWLNEESGFEAEGHDPVAGFRVCTAPPRTILERGEGGGGFAGVALWLDGDDLVVVSQLQAGWWRYVSEWRLSADGTIRPRFGAAAVRNPASCRPHTHHAYWRLDFDVFDGGQNLVQEFNDPRLPGQLAPWHTIRYEVSRPRDAGRRRMWRVRTIRSPHGYTVVPGPNDGHADAFGAGDVWVLAHHGEEIDDGEGFTIDPARARPQLDRLVSGELVEREDLVVWYGVHLLGTGDGPGGDGAPGRAGPDLTPFSWKPPPERQAYGVLVPPEIPPAEDDEEWDEEDEE